ncbi:MAG: type II secretion system protein GspL [Roseibium album]|uniref:type II secretion system protein GspL n=1 Tax=Roseibium album TaxID=311410 RepID=UPI0032ED7363
MPKLFIRLLSPAVATDEGYRVSSAWMIQEDDGRTRAHGETDFRGLSELIDPGTDWIQNPANIVVTVPGEQVLTLSCDVPGRSVGQMRRALPFVVEEFVTTDIESMHLANGELKRGAPTRASLIERTLLDEWLACLAALEIRPGYLFSEAELLPVADRQASVLLDGDRVLVRTHDQAAAVDRDNLVLGLGALDVDRLLVAYGELTALERGELSQELEVDTDHASTADSVLAFVAEQWRNADAVNLLQGEYRARQQSNPLWVRWRPAAALAGVWIGVALFAMVAQAWYADYRADDLEATSEALYRDIFPNERRVTNPRRQLQAKLGDRPDDGSSGFVELLGPLAAAMTPDTRIQNLNYTDERGELAVDLLIGGFDGLDRLKEQLAGQGVNVDITSAEQAENGVRGRVRLSGAGAGR